MVSTSLEWIIFSCPIAIGQADHTQEMGRETAFIAKKQDFSTESCTWEGGLFQGVQKMLIQDTNLPWVLVLPTKMIWLPSCNSL